MLHSKFLYMYGHTGSTYTIKKIFTAQNWKKEKKTKTAHGSLWIFVVARHEQSKWKTHRNIIFMHFHPIGWLTGWLADWLCVSFEIAMADRFETKRRRSLIKSVHVSCETQQFLSQVIRFHSSYPTLLWWSSGCVKSRLSTSNKQTIRLNSDRKWENWLFYWFGFYCARIWLYCILLHFKNNF